MKYCEFCKEVETYKRFCTEKCRSAWRRANGLDRGNPNNRKKVKKPTVGETEIVKSRTKEEFGISLENGLRQAANGETVSFGDFTQYADTDSSYRQKSSVHPPSIVRSPEPIEVQVAPKNEVCYMDDCARPMEESIIIEHPDLKRLHLTLRVSLCRQHKYLLREVA